MTRVLHGKREKTVTAPAYTAACHGCGWESTAQNALANAARHHDAHHHAVTVTIERAVTFGNPDHVPPGQLDLTDPADLALAELPA